MTTTTQYPIPAFFDPAKVGEVWRVPYQQRAADAETWAQQHQIAPATHDSTRICLVAIDVQNTFCLPDHELFVGGRSGMGAVEDNVRLCEFIYRHLGVITTIVPTLDTHMAMQIFHPIFWLNEAGEYPAPMTVISYEDVESGKWRVNPAIAPNIPSINATMTADELQRYAIHYVRSLNLDSKYPLTIWPYHSMLGGIGHALVAAVEEACFVHAIARRSQTQYEIKGGNPLTENYSVLKPEVLEDQQNRAIAQKNTSLINRLLSYDAIIIAGQAKSHCVAWTIDDLLTEIQATDPTLAHKVYLLEDCTSPVVVSDVVDFSDQADAAFQRFADSGMHVIKSTAPLSLIAA